MQLGMWRRESESERGETSARYYQECLSQSKQDISRWAILFPYTHTLSTRKHPSRPIGRQQQNPLRLQRNARNEHNHVPKTTPILHAHVHSGLIKVFITCKSNTRRWNLQCTSTDFSYGVAEGSRSSWLQTLGNQLITLPHTLGILTANTTYCIILLQCVNESPGECTRSE